MATATATPTVRRAEQRDVEIEIGVEGRKIVGYASVFDAEADMDGEFRERIAPGAFQAAFKHPRFKQVVALYNHDKSQVLGRVGAGTLRMAEDSHGLHVEITPPNTSFARDLRKSIERGDVGGQSFKMFPAKNGGEIWDFSQSPPLRTIASVEELLDVGPVTYPRYSDTTAALRSRDELRAAVDRLALRRARLAALEKKLKGA